MTAWSEADGWRMWPVAPGVRWRQADGRIVAERDGEAMTSLTPSELELATARRVKAKLAEGASDVISRLVSDESEGRWYLRALLSLAAIECPRAELPCLGDCRRDGVAVPCGSVGADAPRSAGYYQITRGTAPRTGFTFAELQRDPQANHAGALALARAEVGRHGMDFPTLAVIWNAGSVRPDARNAWRVHTWTPELVSRYVRAWNAIGPVQLERGASPGAGGALLAGAALAWVLSSCSASTNEREAARAAVALTREVCAIVTARDPHEDVRRLCAVNDVAGAVMLASSSRPEASCRP